MNGIADLSISDTPLVIVDLETTGLHPNGDAIVEIGVARIDPGKDAVLVLDTLIDPGRHVTGTEFHGITDAHVRGAPRFGAIAPVLMDALDGAVLAAYNVYFDVRFLEAELASAGFLGVPPHVCLMYMRPLLGIGKRCTLVDACAHADIPVRGAHVAADDALLGAALWGTYVPRMAELQIALFSHLAARKSYKFFSSFENPRVSHRKGIRSSTKSRRATLPTIPQPLTRAERLNEYWSSLKTALADLDVSTDEVLYLRSKASELGLTWEERRSLHARAFAGVLASVSDDHLLTNQEVESLHHVSDGLRRLGWAPGDPLTPLEPRPSGLLSRLFGRA